MKYGSVAEAFNDGIRKNSTSTGEASLGWAVSKFGMLEIDTKYTDSDASGGLTYAELQDYVNLVVELIAAMKIGDEAFNYHKAGTWVCVNTPKNNKPSCSTQERKDLPEHWKMAEIQFVLSE